MSNLVSCFCIKCKTGGKPFDSVSSRARQNHEKADRFAYGRRMEYYGKEGIPKQDKSNPNKKSKKEEVIQPVFFNDSEDEECEEHPEVIQLGEQNASNNVDSTAQNDENNDEEEDEVEQRMSHRD
ncbi:unnamed protein product [Rhizopus stolonifer]